jgi:phosphoglucan, water dikinase
MLPMYSLLSPHQACPRCPYMRTYVLLLVLAPTGKVATLAFANFSEALVPAAAGATAPAAPRPMALSYAAGSLSGGASLSSGSRGSSEGQAAAAAGVLHACARRLVDYSRQPLSTDSGAREALGKRIGAVAALLEAEFGGPQDVEGCLVGEELYVVQTRPQPM